MNGIIIVRGDFTCFMEAVDVRNSDISVRCVTRAGVMFGK